MLACSELNQLEMALGRGNIRTEVKHGSHWVQVP
jgi:hypothetical protein